MYNINEMMSIIVLLVINVKLGYNSYETVNEIIEIIENIIAHSSSIVIVK